MKRFGVAALLGVSFLLSSCEKMEMLEGAGETVAVNFSLGDIDYKGDETVTRGYSSEAEAVRAPLGDGMFVFATLEEDEPSTRAGVVLKNGVKVRVVAYNGTTLEEKSMEYEVQGGALMSATALTIETGYPYTFVAYSYNSDVSPTYPATTITMAPTTDLLWGSVSKTITPTDNSVQITMKHQFAQVRVKATTTKVSAQPAIKALNGVTVTPGNQVDLTIKTGAVAKNAAAATQTVSVWNNLNTTTVTSDPILVYTSTTNPVYVNIGSVVIDGYVAFTGISPVAFKKALAAGMSYTLVVNFQKTIFAKSNVYWKWNDDDDHTQGGYMTFDKEENGHQGYQGLFFKWGSLVGISPVGAWANNSTPIYKAGESAPTTASSWASILSESLGRGIAVSAPDVSTLKGDICTYIDADYRYPAHGVLGTEMSQVNWVRYNAWGNLTTNKSDGTYDFIAQSKVYMKHTAVGNVIFPISGYRRNTDGSLMINDIMYHAGNLGLYWLRTISSGSSNPYSVYFTSTGLNMSYYDFSGGYAVPVRCAQN